MSLNQTIANDAAKTMLATLGGWMKNAGQLAREMWTGRWVTTSSYTVKNRISKETFANGVKVTTRGNGKPVATVPASWMKGKVGRLRELREGSWVTRYTYNSETREALTTFANGVHVVRQGNKKPVVTLPPGFNLGARTKI